MMLLQFALLATASLAQRTCTVEPTPGRDDSPAFRAALESCKSNGIVVFKAGVNYNIWSQVASPRLSNVQIRVLGNLHLPANISRVQATVRAGGATWISIAGSQVVWEGARERDGGWIDSHGEAWWDANAVAHGTGLPNRPHLLAWRASDGVLRRFKSRKPIAWNVGIGAERVLVEDAEIDALAAPGRGFPFNTDGFGVTGKHVTIRRSRVFNGDDAVAVQDGARDLLVEDCVIGYQTHGLSIGSLGKNPKKPASVANIAFRNVTVDGGLYAARFKSWRGGQGLVSNVSWSDIKVQNVTFPIFVTQTYTNQEFGRAATSGKRGGRGSGTNKGMGRTKTKADIEDGRGAVAPAIAPATVDDADADERAAHAAQGPPAHAVQMRNFRWRNFSGTINSLHPGDGSCVAPCWYYDGLPKDLRHTEAVVMQCALGGGAATASCQGFELSGIDLRPEAGARPSAVCENVQAERNPRLGFVCASGEFKVV